MHLAPQDTSLPPTIVALVGSEDNQESHHCRQSPTSICVQLEPCAPNSRVVHDCNSDAPTHDQDHLRHGVRRRTPKIREKAVAFPHAPTSFIEHLIYGQRRQHLAASGCRPVSPVPVVSHGFVEYNRLWRQYCLCISMTVTTVIDNSTVQSGCRERESVKMSLPHVLRISLGSRSTALLSPADSNRVQQPLL